MSESYTSSVYHATLRAEPYACSECLHGPVIWPSASAMPGRRGVKHVPGCWIRSLRDGDWIPSLADGVWR